MAVPRAHSLTSRLLRSLPPNSCVQYQVLTGLAMDGVPIECPAVRLPYNGFTYSGARLVARPVFVDIATTPARSSAPSPPSNHAACLPLARLPAAIVAMPAGNITVANGEASIETEVGAIPYSEALYACRQAVSERTAVLESLCSHWLDYCTVVCFPVALFGWPPGGELLAVRGCTAGLEWLGAATPWYGAWLQAPCACSEALPLSICSSRCPSVLAAQVAETLGPAMAGGNYPASESPVNLYLPRWVRVTAAALVAVSLASLAGLL